MVPYIATSLYFGSLLALSMMEPETLPMIPLTPPSSPSTMEGMTPYDFNDFSNYLFPPPPQFGYPLTSRSFSMSQPALSPLSKPDTIHDLFTIPITDTISPPSSANFMDKSTSKPTTKSNIATAPTTDESSIYPSLPLGTKPDDPDGFDITKYSYDNTGRLAGDVYRLVHPPREEFIGAHIYFMLESPTARAISEYRRKVKYAKNNSGEACLAKGEETALRDFRKRHAEVVLICEAGWKMNETYVDRARSLMKTVDDLDYQAYQMLRDCKPGQTCYAQFKQSPLAAGIDTQLKDIRKSQLVELRVLADQSHVLSLYQLYKCNADMSDAIRKDVYSSIAKMNVCLSTAGLITTM